MEIVSPASRRAPRRAAESPRHVCAFVRDDQDLERSFAAFLEEGERRGERSLIIGDPEKPGRRGWDEAHLREGRFCAATTLAWTHEWLKLRRRTRCLVEMGWARQADPRELLRYEDGLNHVLRGRLDVIVCVYNLDWPAPLEQILKRHPVVMMNGRAWKNPLYRLG